MAVQMSGTGKLLLRYCSPTRWIMQKERRMWERKVIPYTEDSQNDREPGGFKCNFLRQYPKVTPHSLLAYSFIH